MSTKTIGIIVLAALVIVGIIYYFVYAWLIRLSN